jgi:hypothetical protein
MAADIQYATHLQMSQGYQLLNQLPAASEFSPRLPDLITFNDTTTVNIDHAIM